VIAASRAELLKVRTARLPWGLLLIALGLTTLHSVLFDSNAGGTGHTAIKSLATYAGQNQAVAIPSEVLLIATILGVVLASGEFRHRTATATYLATPNRLLVLGAKAFAAAATGALFGLVTSLLATGIGISFIAARGHHGLLSVATISRYTSGSIIACALLAAAGVALGSIIRSQVGAIISVFVWAFVLEQSIGGLYSAVQRYLPYTAAAALAGTADRGTSPPLPFVAGVALVAGVGLLLTGIAASTTLTNDIG
jgi:ABC-2 type transport system permease protein